MNIYIYGSKSFKNDVHDELDHCNIKFKLDDSSAIIDIDNLDDLRHLVAHNKEDIFLIDDAKIIKKDALQGKFKSKLKFLIPKDGIEEEFLFEHGVGDISFDSMDELATHITNKIKQNSTSDDFDNRDEIHESISSIVNDAYEEEGDDGIKLNDELSTLLVSNEDELVSQDSSDVPLNEKLHVEPYRQETKQTSTSPQKSSTTENLDDFLADVPHMEISNEEFGHDEMLQQLEDLTISNDDFQKEQEVKKKNPINETAAVLDEQLDALEISNADFNGTMDEVKTQNTQTTEDIQGDFEMAGDFSSLDDINESDIIAALNGEEVAINETQVLTTTNKNEPVSLNINNTDDISELLSKLLKNKTLEITVKIKE